MNLIGKDVGHSEKVLQGAFGDVLGGRDDSKCLQMKQYPKALRVQVVLIYGSWYP